jgi:polyisoprenoid-binding protein YceI
MSSTTATPTNVTTWNLDPAHSSAEFKVRHLMISNVKGSFRGLKGMLTLDKANPANSSVKASADVNTIATGDEQRDAHLKTPEFFDAAKYPEITFQSTSVKSLGSDEFQVTGDLTIHGVTKPVVFAVEDLGEPGKDPWGNLRIGLTAIAKINRKDFDLSWNAALETGGVLVGEEVTMTLDVEFIKAA